MWLEVKQTATVGILAEEELVVPIVADIFALTSELVAGEPDSYRSFAGLTNQERQDAASVAPSRACSG